MRNGLRIGAWPIRFDLGVIGLHSLMLLGLPLNSCLGFGDQIGHAEVDGNN